jgi:hypothetical protein
MKPDEPKPQYGVVFPDGRIEWDSIRLGKQPETAEEQGKAQDQYKREIEWLGVDPASVSLKFVKREWKPGKETDITV